MPTVHILSGDQPYPAGADLLYEAEWNEEASPSQQAGALLYFAAQRSPAVETAARAALAQAEAVERLADNGYAVVVGEAL